MLGSPIGHSLSPVLHRAAYRQLGLEWNYEAVEVAQPDLAAFLAGCGPQWAGLSLTMPLKRAVLPLLDTASELVRLIGAANTVVFDAAGHRAGHNTDVAGMVATLRELGAVAGPGVVIGAGATAACALAALHELGCRSVLVLARRPDAARGELAGLADGLGQTLVVEPLPSGRRRLPSAPEASVTICTLPGAAGGVVEAAVPERPGVLLDVAYEPWPPPLLRGWRAAGGRGASGEEMLLHQAVGQVELMTGRRPDPAVMRSALRAELERRHGQPD